MADNYLEKKMEEHRTTSRPKMRAPKKSRAIFIRDVFSIAGINALKENMAAADCHIAFAADDYAKGSRLAQSTGARFYCITPRLSLAQAISQAKVHFSGVPFDVI